MSGPASSAQKKRKANGTMEEDRSMYAAFSGAANSISHLYTQTVLHQRRHYAAGGRDFADRLLTWAREREACGEAAIPTAQLIACLEQEVEALTADEEQACASPAATSAVVGSMFASAARGMAGAAKPGAQGHNGGSWVRQAGQQVHEGGLSQSPPIGIFSHLSV